MGCKALTLKGDVEGSILKRGLWGIAGHTSFPAAALWAAFFFPKLSLNQSDFLPMEVQGAGESYCSYRAFHFALTDGNMLPLSSLISVA